MSVMSVVRVREIDPDQLILQVEAQNGNMLAVDFSDRDGTFEIGEVLLIDNDGDLQGRVSRSFWKTNPSIGVVKLKNSENTLVTFGVSLRRIPTVSEVDYDVNCTVAYDELWGVTRLIARAAVTAFDRVMSVVRVRAIVPDKRVLNVEAQNGNMLVANFVEIDGSFAAGDIIIIDNEGNFQEHVSRDFWTTTASVGVVRFKGNHVTLVSNGTAIRTVPTVPDVQYDVNSTVAYDELWGVTQLVTPAPVTIFDRDNDEADVSNYLVSDDQIANESFDDFGGYGHIVERAKMLIEIPLKYAARLAEIGASPVKGVLFTGDPGTGKTKLARIIANEVDAAFYAVSASQIFSKWYGSSERLIGRLFDEARACERAIIFIDEIDSVAGQRGDNSHEVSRRVVAQLLTSMDGLKANPNTIVIAATNRAEDIDSALRRPGRFDWEINFPAPEESDRLAILQVAGRKMAKDGSIDLARLARETDGWSPAYLSSIWSEAALFAAVGGRSTIIEEDLVRAYEQMKDQRLNRRTS